MRWTLGLTSAAVTQRGPWPVAKVCWGAKLAVAAPRAVVLSSTETVLPAWLAKFATIRWLTAAAQTALALIAIAARPSDW